MPSRKLPYSDDQRLIALQVAFNKAEITDDKSPLSAETYGALASFLPQFETELTERGIALRDQAEATRAKDLKKDQGRMYCAHFFQVFNLAVARGMYSAADRAYYQLDVNQESLPVLTAETDVMLWLERIVKGENARVMAGGIPMSHPSVAEIETLKSEYDVTLATASTEKDQYDKETEDVANLRNAADALIREIWDEVEFHFRKSEDTSLRSKAREWGVVYINRPGETPEEGVLPGDAVVV